VVALRGAVATSSPQAAQAGLAVLRDGGNAVDAAVAATAVLGVVEPMMTGVGGDLFALLWSEDTGTVTAFNGSGRSPARASLAALASRGHASVPEDGTDAVLAVSVPGAVDAWDRVLARFGTMSLDQVLRPSIELARDGFAVPEGVAQGWARAAGVLVDPDGDLLPGGSAPRAGERVALPALARTLEAIAREGARVVYDGEIADRIAGFVGRRGGWLTGGDLSRHEGEWVDPISVRYRGSELVECPPNGQGLAALVAAALADGFDASGPAMSDPSWTHVLIEATKVGLAEAFAIAGGDHAAAAAHASLATNRIHGLRRALAAAGTPGAIPRPPFRPPHDTAYVCVVDRRGNAASMISSLFRAFGSGLVVPGTGIVLQNRGALFSADPGHPSALRGAARPFHTIMPAMVLEEGRLRAAFGVVGGYQQVQAHVQLLSHLVDARMSPQAALDVPRFSLDVEGARGVRVEPDTPSGTVDSLRAMGHHVNVAPPGDARFFGAGQILAVDGAGVITGGTDPRRDGLVAAW
jgi:gamma-glutamyltranspeptidase / glutathione hydrolase